MKFSSCCTLLLSAYLLSYVVGCGKPKPIEPIEADQTSVKLQPRETRFPTNWPGWRGPDQSGVMVESNPNLPISWSETENIRWKADVPGRGHGSPVVVNGFIYLNTATENPEQQKVLCFSSGNGEMLWETAVNEGGFPPPNQMHPKSSHANGTVACDMKHVYTAFLNHGKITATALSALTGEIVWQRELGSFESKFGYAPSPTLYNSFVLFACDHRGSGYLIALDADTGEIAWKMPRPAVSTYSSPRVVTLDNVDQLIISGGEVVSSYSPINGKELWSAPGTAEATCGTIVVSGNRVIASGGYPQKQMVCLSDRGEQLWTNRVKAYEPSLIVVDENIYAVDDDGIAYSIDPSNGEIRWKERLGGNFSSSPFASDDRIYVTNLDGKTFVFRANPDKFEKLAENQLGSDCYSSFAAVQDWLFTRVGYGAGKDRQEKLICIGPATDPTTPPTENPEQ